MTYDSLIFELQDKLADYQKVLEYRTIELAERQSNLSRNLVELAQDVEVLADNVRDLMAIEASRIKTKIERQVSSGKRDVT